MKDGKFVVGVFVGVVAGIAAGVLLTPYEGKESRRKVTVGAKRAYGSSSKYFNFSQKKADKLKLSVSEKVDSLIERAEAGDKSARVELENIARNVNSSDE